MISSKRVAVAQSVKQLATDWTIEGLEFEYREGKNVHFTILSRPAISPEVKRLVRQIYHSRRGQENVDLYIHSPIRLMA
jgi:hypothetical protein